VLRLTLFTLPSPDIKGQASDLIEANIAGFGARKESVYFKVDFPFLLCFVFQHGTELTPSHLADCLSETVIFDHVPDC
jgi:hypothetical protein